MQNEAATLRELIILGYMFVEPRVVAGQMDLLYTNNIFQSKLAQPIWKKIYEYYKKFGSLPVDLEVKQKLFTQEELRLLKTSVRAATDDEARALFYLEDIRKASKLNVIDDLKTRLLTLLDTSTTTTPDLAKAEESVLQTYRTLTGIDTAGSVAGVTESIAQVFSDWCADRLPTQQKRSPICIAGLEDYFDGIPRGEINYVAAAYGVGKTAILCGIADEASNYGNVLYVTLEIPVGGIAFKIAAHRTNGAIPMKSFMQHAETVDDSVLTSMLHLEFKNDIYFFEGIPQATTANDIHNHLVFLETEKGVKIDTLVVDYGDRLGSMAGTFETLGWLYMQSVADELATVAKKHNLLCWTASQMGRESIQDRGSTKLKPLIGRQVWGSLGKLMTGCIGIGVTGIRSRLHPRLCAVVFSTLKNRYGEFFGDLLGIMDYATGRISDLRVVEESESEPGTLYTTAMEILGEAEVALEAKTRVRYNPESRLGALMMKNLSEKKRGQQKKEEKEIEKKEEVITQQTSKKKVMHNMSTQIEDKLHKMQRYIKTSPELSTKIAAVKEITDAEDRSNGML